MRQILYDLDSEICRERLARRPSLFSQQISHARTRHCVWAPIVIPREEVNKVYREMLVKHRYSLFVPTCVQECTELTCWRRWHQTRTFPNHAFLFGTVLPLFTWLRWMKENFARVPLGNQLGRARAGESFVWFESSRFEVLLIKLFLLEVLWNMHQRTNCFDIL